MRASPRQRLGLVLVVTTVCLVGTSWGLRPERVAAALREVHWPFVVLSVACIAASTLARALRNQLLLGDARPSFERQVVASGIGNLAVQVVPLRLGELVRPTLLASAGVPFGRSLGAWAVERALDVLVLLGMLVAAGAVDLPAEREVGGVDLVGAGQRAAAVGAAVLGSALVALALGGEAAAVRLAPLPVVGGPAARLTRAAHAVLAELGGRPAAGAGAFLSSLAVWGASILSVVALLEALPGLPHGPAAALTVTAVTTAGVVAVPTPGMVGAFEASCVAVLGAWAVDRGAATAFALLWHALVFGFHASFGAALLAREGVSLWRLVEQSRAAPTESP